MNTTLIVRQFMAENRGLTSEQFFDYLRDSRHHKRSSSEEFKRQLGRFGYSFPDDDALVEFLIECLREQNIRLDNARDTLNRIVRGRVDETGREEKNVIPSEETLYKLCFALRLNPEQARELFQKAFGLRGFNLRAVNDIVYYHCLLKGQEGRGYNEAARFIHQCAALFEEADTDSAGDVNLEQSTNHFALAMNAQLEALDWESEEAVLAWIKANKRELVGYSRTAALKYLEQMFRLRTGLITYLLNRGRQGDRIFGRYQLTALYDTVGVKARAMKKRADPEDRELQNLLEAFGAANNPGTKADLWNRIMDELNNRYGELPGESEDDVLAYEDKYRIAYDKFEFAKALLPSKQLFWLLFDPERFGKGEEDDPVPGLDSFLTRSYWSAIDQDPRRLTWRPRTVTTYKQRKGMVLVDEDGRKIVAKKEKAAQSVTDPLAPQAAAREWARDDVRGRKILIIIFFYQYITGCMMRGSVPQGTYHEFYDELKTLLLECGYQPPYERNYFDSIILQSVIDFEENFSGGFDPNDMDLSAGFFNEILGKNYESVVAAYRDFEETGEEVDKGIKPELRL